MNKAILIGRLTGDPKIRKTQDGKTVASYTLAVDRYGKDKGADFINCVAFDKRGEFAENYFHKGMKVAVCGRIQTGSYEGKNGKVYTTDIIVKDQEFCEKKESAAEIRPEAESEGGFIDIPEGMQQELPFR